MCSRQQIAALSLATLSLCGIAAVIAISERRRLHKVAKKDTVIITHKIISQHAKDEKDIISQQAANENVEKDIISQQGADEEDIISQLPDQILISIITHMPTKLAIRTSILSKRWRNLYKFVSHIDFHCHEFWHPEKERFLRLRSRIRSFHFRCFVTKPYTDQFEQCIYSLRRLGVEQLIVYFSCCKHFPSCRKSSSCCRKSSDLSFSAHLLSEIPTLKYFQLGLCSLGPSLQSPCNSLQTLGLIDVTLLPGALDSILSNCLSLHSVTLDCCDCPSVLCFRGPNLRLKSLILRDCEGVKEIELHAGNLITFEFHNRRPNIVNVIFDHIPQLQSIHLDSHNQNTKSSVFGMLPQDLPHLKSLAFPIRDDFYQLSKRLTGMETKMFNSLRRLELKVYCTLETNLLAVRLILESCPSLQEFHLSEFHFSEYHLDVSSNAIQLVFLCFLIQCFKNVFVDN